MKLIIVTGLSGSGKTSAMKNLEDMGYYCVDNLPISFIPQFINFCESGSSIQQLALSVDTRAIGTMDEFLDIINELRKTRKSFDLVFTEATPHVLIRRYSESRRPHPFREGSLEESIDLEIKTLSKLKDIADIIIDTSRTNIHEFKRIFRKYIESTNDVGKLNIYIISFGFKFGIPIESDLILDVRFLPNPYFDENLKPLTGMDQPVIRYLSKLKETKILLKRYFALLNFLLHQYAKEGRSRLTISIGCTGGRHRSVFIANRIKRHLRKRYPLLHVSHRDIDK